MYLRAYMVWIDAQYLLISDDALQFTESIIDKWDCLKVALEIIC